MLMQWMNGHQAMVMQMTLMMVLMMVEVQCERSEEGVSGVRDVCGMRWSGEEVMVWWCGRMWGWVWWGWGGGTPPLLPPPLYAPPLYAPSPLCPSPLCPSPPYPSPPSPSPSLHTLAEEMVEGGAQQTRRRRLDCLSDAEGDSRGACKLKFEGGEDGQVSAPQ